MILSTDQRAEGLYVAIVMMSRVLAKLPARTRTVCRPRKCQLQFPSPMSSDDALLDRLQSFVSENKRGVLIGAAAAAAVIAIGGVAYYNRAAGGDDVESLKSDKRKDKKKQKKQKKSVKDKDGPILEERKPKGTEVSDDGALNSPDAPLVL